MKSDKSPTAPDSDAHSVVKADVGLLPAEQRYGEDLDLMTQVAAGNTSAQKTVAVRLVRRVRRLARLMLLDETLADDASQVAIMEILHSAHTYRGQSSLERWADRITVRSSLRQKRDERRRDQVTEPIENVDDFGAVPDSTGSLLEATPRPVDEYLSVLPPAQREVLILKHSFDYTVEEIADLTGVAVGTVKDRLVTARRQVRKLIQRDLALGTSKGGRQ